MNSRLNHRLLIAALVAALLGVFWCISHVSLDGYNAFDYRLSDFIRSWRHPVLDPPMLIATLLGNWLVVTVTFTTLCLMLLYQQRWVLLTALVTTITGAGAFVSGIKLIVAEGRPELDLYERGVSVYAFPSGHTTFSSLLGLWLIWLAVRGIQNRVVRWLSVSVLVLILSMVAVSRIYLGAHWPTDIVAGFLFSISLALIFTLVFEHQATDHKADLKALQASIMAYVLSGLMYVSYQWPSAIIMYALSS